MKTPSRLFSLRVAEVIAAVVLTFGFRSLVDWLLAPLPLGSWIVLIRWLLLILLIGAAIRLHSLLIAFLKKRGLITRDPW